MNLEVAIRIIERDRWRIDSGGLAVFENLAVSSMSWTPASLTRKGGDHERI